MKLLAIETSATECSLALQIEEQLTYLDKHAPMQQSQLLLTAIKNLLLENKIALNQLDAIAFGCGPGSFTGVRIATSTAQGLGFAASVPLIPISSLAGLAQAAYEELGWEKLLVAVDARINEIYWGAYQVNEKGEVELMGKEYVSAPEKITIAGKNWRGVGNAWEIYANKIMFQPEQIDASRVPMARGILKLAKTKAAKGDWVKPGEAMPTYLRDEVAKKGNKS